MANSFGSGTNNVVVAQTFLNAFAKALSPVGAFSTNFSDAAAQPGDTIKVGIETYPNVAAATKATHAAYAEQDIDSTIASLTLGQPVYVSLSLDDVERASSTLLNLENFMAAKANHLARTVYQTILADVTNVNYSSKVTVASGDFDIDDVIDMKDLLDDLDVPQDGRSLVLSYAYINNLLKDNTLSNNFNAGPAPLRQGVVGNLLGMDVYGTAAIPANSENLTGFACHRSAMAVAMRYLQPGPGNTYSEAMPVSDAESGITLGMRRWYENSTGVDQMVFECVFDSAVAQNALARVVSA
jgi:hypothetical protein